MKKVDISSMFLVPENIYISMLSHIYENDVRENIKSLNGDKDNGNYIEKAINFNKQQERQRKQVILNPNATNETVRTNANTDANTSVQTDNLNQTFDNTESFHTPMINQSVTAVTSTPKKSRAVSRIRPLFSPMRPIEKSFSETDAEGNYVCSFCNNKYKKADELQIHFATHPGGGHHRCGGGVQTLDLGQVRSRSRCHGQEGCGCPRARRGSKSSTTTAFHSTTTTITTTTTTTTTATPGTAPGGAEATTASVSDSEVAMAINSDSEHTALCNIRRGRTRSGPRATIGL